MNTCEDTFSKCTANQPPRRWILSEEYSLRGWKDEPFFLERAGNRYLRQLDPDEFLYLLKCD